LGPGGLRRPARADAARPRPTPDADRDGGGREARPADGNSDYAETQAGGVVVIKLSDYVMQFVARQGVEHVFFLPGGGCMHLADSLGRAGELTAVCNYHEQACAIGAEAYARATNHLGVALVTTGPGGTNTVTGVADAWCDSTPCLFLSGQVKRADMIGELGVRQMGPQEVDVVSIVRPPTKYA